MLNTWILIPPLPPDLWHP